MFFILSKIFWFFARPLNLLFFIAVAALVLGRLGWSRTARAMLVFALAAFALIGFTQLPDWLIYRMETAVSPAVLPDDPTRIGGIIVLGGGLSANAQAVSSGYHLGEAGDRIIAGLALKRRYPAARLIYTGGLATIRRDGQPETDAAGLLTRDLYGDDLGIELEGRAANTWQNAVYVSRMIAEPDRGKAWLLVTSAFHMPRALGVFDKTGIEILPVPVDYRADPLVFPWITGETSYQFLKFALFVKEGIGLAAYRATGRIARLPPRMPPDGAE